MNKIGDMISLKIMVTVVNSYIVYSYFSHDASSHDPSANQRRHRRFIQALERQALIPGSGYICSIWEKL